jgi:folate-dependent phosphoribosylglycinamide formyltransferase PurN
MKVVMLIGNNPRHFHIAKQVEATGYLAGLVVEEREAYIPEAPAHLGMHLKNIFNKHFQDRSTIENNFFGLDYEKKPQVPTLNVSLTELNSKKVWDFTKKINPQVAISYGVHKLTDETLSHLPADKWNSHGGLSPWYRGCITHFWPSYMLEPQMTGVTLHMLTAQLDAGPVVHQTVANLVKGDGIHDLACRAVKSYGEELPKVLEIYKKGNLKKLDPQKSSGKLWLAKDWRPEHLSLIYDFYENKIVDRYLSGDFYKFEPQLVKQF